MFTKFIALTLCLLLVGAAPAFAKPQKQTKEEKSKKQIVEWGTNKNIGVKLNSGEAVAGRIAEIKDDLFTVQFVKDGKITTRDVRYDEVKKLSGKDGGKAGKIVGYTALGVLAGVGVVIVAVLAAWANN